MTVRFYIASGWDNKDQVRELAWALTANNGWVWTYNWTACTEDDDFREIAAAEITAVKDSNVVIVLLPGGRGTHIEMGAALAFNKPVALVCDEETARQPKAHLPPVYFHPQVGWFAKSPPEDLARRVADFIAAKTPTEIAAGKSVGAR